ncbi:hypothetical protein [Lactiplantibacillus herbarum]|uniref:hypothetical protein n=1 Tax=Lactiplantibacillus herbarum TaxID=1670446 RepID=UPI00069E6FDB|nr:hypothetical protein [Lactiplantibacillus herbarum]
MKRYRVFVKGSDQELTWLNQQAEKGRLLTDIKGNWYQFGSSPVKYRLFSEYVTPDVVAELTREQADLKVITTVQITQPEIQVIYTGIDQQLVPQTRVQTRGDYQMQLKVAETMRAHLLTRMNLTGVIGLVMLVILAFVTYQSGNETYFDDFASWCVMLWIIAVSRPAWVAHRIHRIIVDLRVRTQDYTDAWMPTQHVFFQDMPTELDLDKLKSLGRWRLVGQNHKGMYWYDLQTLASLAEIKQTVQAEVGPDVTGQCDELLGPSSAGIYLIIKAP